MKNSLLSIDNSQFYLNGKPFQVLSGELHYPRIPREYWRHRLRLARAMGLNTICTVLFWNLHEPKPGQFNFSDNLDIVSFIRMAHDEGLYVIIRPGPYICAEWDFGGLPIWLLEIPDIQLRCGDPRFIEATKRYISRIAEEITPLQSTRNGPIIMVQVENEYGYYGHDKEYMACLKNHLIGVGFDVMLFTSDAPERHRLYAGTLPDILSTANFGSKPEINIPKLRAFRSSGPIMCGEFWTGWFDHWGKKRQGTEHADGVQHTREIEWMMQNQIGFNIYMFHGGSNFSFTAGANETDGVYCPTVTSYDYWAPIDEAGRPTNNYFAWRQIFSKYQAKTSHLPSIPESNSIIAIPRFELTDSSSLFDHLPEAIKIPQPRCMEAFGQHHGCMLYRTQIAGLQPGKLKISHMHDYAQVFLNGHKIVALDRRLGQDCVQIDEIPEGFAQLDILVEGMGHVNFGPGLIDRKGIGHQVTLANLVLMNWQVFGLPLDHIHLKGLRYRNCRKTNGPSFLRGHFELEKIGDTFLDMRGWGKGYVWINGHNIGRYWHIGPQQTLYIPGPWLQRGENEIVVFDLEFTGHCSTEGLAEPILDSLARP